MSHALTFSVVYLLYLPCDIPDFKVTIILFYIIMLYVVQKLYNTLKYIVNPHVVKLVTQMKIII